MKKNPAAVALGSIKSAKKAAAARENGKKGGRPKKTEDTPVIKEYLTPRTVPEIHVIPIDDQIEHRADCECCTAYPDGYGLWIHHSADKREQYERNGHLGKGWIVAKKDEQTGQLIPV